MAEAPPSYEEVVGSYSETTNDVGVQTFWPIYVTSGSGYSEFQRFGVLMERANLWLQQHSHYEAFTCETLEQKVHHTVEVNENQSMSDLGTGSGTRIKGLRIWVRHKQSDTPQQLLFEDFIPRLLSAPRTRAVSHDDARHVAFEKMSAVVPRINERLKVKPLQRSVISVNTVTMCEPVEQFDPTHIDTQKCKFEDVYEYHKFSFLRVFYEVSPPAYEIIGIADFSPDVRCNVYGGYSDKFAPNSSKFNSVSAKASAWLRSKSDIKVTNLQTLYSRGMRAPETGEINADTMKAYEYKPEARYRMGFLRVAYTQKWEDRTPACMVIPALKHHNFYPMWAPGSYQQKPQDFGKTVKFIQSWLRISGARVLCMETHTLTGRAKQLHRDLLDADDSMSFEGDWSFTSDVYTRNRSLLCCRAYLIGPYREPKVGELPAVFPPPVTEECVIV